MTLNIRPVMPPRYILRPPKFGGTPRRLKRYLQAERVFKVPGDSNQVFDWNRDFFMAYPPQQQVDNAPDDYQELRAVYASNKVHQRQWLASQGLAVPLTYTALHEPFGQAVGEGQVRDFVVRPLRHAQGQGYRVTQDSSDFDPRTEYLSAVFPKRWEYRIVLVKGHPLLTLIKRTDQDADPTRPWNRSAGFRFITVRNPDRDRLRWTDIYETIEASSALRQFHIVALDIMLGDRRELGLRRTPYAVCEMNFCPSLRISHNLEAIAAHVG